MLERAAACHVYTDDLRRSVTLARRALELLDEGTERRRAAYLYGMLQRSLWNMLRADEATAALEHGLALLADDGPSPERAGLLSRKARMLMLQSRFHRAVAVARRALAEQAELDADGAEHIDEAGALNALGVSLAATGDAEEGVAALQRALDLANAIGRLHDIARRGVEPVARHCTSSAAPTRRSRSRSRRTTGSARCRRASAGSRSRIAQYAFDAGDWERAEQALSSIATRRFTSGNSELNSCLHHAQLALGRDEREAARRQLARAAELAVDSREPQYLGVLGALEAELATREGDVAGARAAVDRALDRIEFCSDDALRMAIASAAGLTSEATARAARARPRRPRRGRGRARPTPSC